jgi:ATP-dependent RNA helicase RhlE
MKQTHRQSAINGFRGKKYDILVATDIAARGIDVSEISHVINFDMPDCADAYTHRIGRTGRAESTGEAWTFTASNDEPMIREIEKILGSRIERRCLPGFASMPSLAAATAPVPVASREGHSRRFRLSNAGRKRLIRNRH